MRILVTGAHGFTGSHFVGQALAAGHQVFELKSDLTNTDALTRELQTVEVDTVVHLAAISYVGHADVSAFYAVNVIGTMNLLEGLLQSGRTFQRVLLASSANVYGNCTTSPIPEQQIPEPVNHYAMSKLAMEHMARTFADRLPLLLTRPFNYTGLGQNHQFLIPKLVEHFAKRAANIYLGNLNVEREFNDVRMVCQAYLRLLEAGVPGETYNVCTGQPHSLTEVLELLVQLTGHRPAIQINPEFVRSNEVQRLCGDPTKLNACIGATNLWSLDTTLRWMLSETSLHAQKVESS